MALIDIVNINADASCMSSNKWLRSLEGGDQSRFCKLLDSYISYDRKVNIGLTGVTIKDLAAFNPEAIEKINSHSEIFEILLRTFSHDLSPLRSKNGYILNLEMGLETINNYFENTVDVFLQNEIMMRNQQIEIVQNKGIKAVFINPERYNNDVRTCISRLPFICHGTGNSEILTIPVADNLTSKYLDKLHRVKTKQNWENLVGGSNLNILWRDGESALLFPRGIEFERMLFDDERHQNVERLFISEKIDDFLKEAYNNKDLQMMKHFPQHQLDHWLSDFKMIWLLEHLNQLEKTIDKQTSVIQKLWLLAINSDIPASSEKKSIKISVHPDVFLVPNDDISWEGVIADEKSLMLTFLRSERFFEGEEYLMLCEELIDGQFSEAEFKQKILKSEKPHLEKVYSRVIL